MHGTKRMTMSRPRVKPEHAPYRVSAGRIRIGGVTYGTAAEIADPDGWVWSLLGAMDGTREPDEIVTAVLSSHPGLPEGTVRAGTQQLVNSGYVEDAGAAHPDCLTERDIQRYDRAVRYYRWLDMTPRASSWEPQALLRRATVTVLGVGGTGGVAALALAASGVGHLRCVDPDLVELSNLSRQVMYSEDDIGQPKVDVAVRRLVRLNSDIEVTGQRLRVSDADDVEPLARSCDVLLLAADQPADVRVWTNRACLAADRPWVNAGYQGPRVQVGAFIPGDGACLECVFLHGRDFQRQSGGQPDQAEGPGAAAAHAVGAASAGICGYLAAHLVISMITGIPPVAGGQMKGVNLTELDAPGSIAWQRHPHCPACG